MAPNKRKAPPTEPGDDDDDWDDHAKELLACRWSEWRRVNPVRAPQVNTVFTKRPSKPEQAAWTMYKTPRQSWFVTPFALNMPKDFSHSLNSTPDKYKLYRYTHQPDGKGTEEKYYEHYTNIHRMRNLATRHPLVSNVDLHKVSKAKDRTDFNARGRATKYHQSPWDLLLTLAASGAQMYVGVTVNKIAENLITMWYQLASGSGREATEYMEAIFLDLCEAQHIEPAEMANRSSRPQTTPPSAAGAFETISAGFRTNISCCPRWQYDCTLWCDIVASGTMSGLAPKLF